MDKPKNNTPAKALTESCNTAVNKNGSSPILGWVICVLSSNNYCADIVVFERACGAGLPLRPTFGSPAPAREIVNPIYNFSMKKQVSIK